MSEPFAALIAIANTKGGCAKSTTTVILAGEYAAQGYTVHIIDADPKKRVLKWGQAGVKPASITISEANGQHHAGRDREGAEQRRHRPDRCGRNGTRAGHDGRQVRAESINKDAETAALQ